MPALAPLFALLAVALATVPGAAFNRAGRLTRRTDASGTIAFEYGAMGETTRVDRTLASTLSGTRAVSVTTRFVHDSFGRMLSMTYPDGERVDYTYDAGGALERVAGTLAGRTSTYVESLRYDAFGSRTTMVSGNGVTTRYAYDPRMRRLANLDATLPSGAVLQQLQYAYTPVGNIHAIANRGVTQVFGYDRLDQLTSATGILTRVLGAGGVGGVGIPVTQRYTQQLAYDEIGNLRRNAQVDTVQFGHAPARNADETSHDLTYGYSDAHPHAPESIGDPSLGIGGTRFVQYDANGNQTHWEDRVPRPGRPTAIVAARDLHWDEENRLASLQDRDADLEFRYDADGERTHRLSLRRRDVTVYTSRYHQLRNGALAMNHVFAGSERVATVMAVAPSAGPGGFAGLRDTLWYHTDRHVAFLVLRGTGDSIPSGAERPRLVYPIRDRRCLVRTRGRTRSRAPSRRALARSFLTDPVVRGRMRIRPATTSGRISPPMSLIRAHDRRSGSRLRTI